MKKKLLIGCLALSTQVFAQTEMFYDYFEDDQKWVLNHSTGVTGNNEFVVNGSYGGNMAIENTPNQHPDMLDQPQSSYLHILPHFSCLGFAPVCNSHYNPNDESNTYAEMAYDISTTAATGVSVSFWYLCKGQTGDAYGNVEYSTDGGATWTSVGPDLVDTANWGHMVITDAAFDNQANLRIRFHWRNSGAGTEGDHALAIDEFRILADNVTHYTSMGHMDGLAFCPGSPFDINVYTMGSYNAGNAFSILMSDENGLFFPGQEIGSVTSTVEGSMDIPVVFPQGLPEGYNYRIRVVSSNPPSTPITSEAFGINPSPTVGISSDPDPATICPGESVELTANGSADVTSYTWSPATGLNSTNTATVTATPASTTTYTIEVTNDDHCSSTRNIEVLVACAGIEENAIDVKLYPNPASDVVHVTAAVNVSKAELLDQSGRTLQTIEVNNTEFDLNISDLTQGVYFVRIDGNTTSRFTKR